jgi:dihydropteroate synthase
MRELAPPDYPLPISVDTSKAAVARACLELGARVINDVTALRGDPR